MNDQLQWLDSHVQTFKERRKFYDEFADTLMAILSRAVSGMGMLPMVQVRAKTIPSFAEKCLRKRDKYKHPADQLTDLCGGRVILESRDKIAQVCEYIQSRFEIDLANSEDKAAQLKAEQFGYLSVHYVVSLKPDVDYPVPVNPALFERRTAEEAAALGLRPGPVYKAEIQVRTLLQHAWASLIHDNLYKATFAPPLALQRIANRNAALLEEADDAFVRLLEGLEFYQTNAGAHMKAEQIRSELEILEAVLAHAGQDRGLAHKIARHAMAVHDWTKAASVLAPYADPKVPGSSAVLRDLGVSRIRLGDHSGFDLLDKALELDPDDAESLCDRGDAIMASDPHQAAEDYARAYRVDPDHPRVVRSYVQSQIHVKKAGPSFVSLLRPNLEACIATCQEWAASSLYLPQAHFDMGYFCLLLGDRVYESLDAYAKGIGHCETRSAVEAACLDLEALRDAWSDQREDTVHALEWTHKLLLAGTVALIMFERDQDAEAVRKLEEGSTDAGSGESDGKIMSGCESAHARLDHARELYTALVREADEARFKYICCQDRVMKRKRYVTTPGLAECECRFNPERPVVIVAGGCDASVEAKIGDYASMFAKAFAGFRGSIVSGGTTAGISGLVGDLSFPYGDVQRVAYLHANLSEPDARHPGYDRVRTIVGQGYTPLGPIQTWVDILACGIPPRNVRVLGINGGQLSAFEYRLALALGATVGIVLGSGREADRILTDPYWGKHPRLLPLPPDAMTLRHFLGIVLPSPISEGGREKMAREIHEEYVRTNQPRSTPLSPSMQPWDALREDFRKSNLAAVDGFATKLSCVGLGIRPRSEDATEPYRLSEEQIAVMAEEEHGRWNVERLSQGWRFGPTDKKNMISDCLVSWKELPPEIQKYDVDIVKAIPQRLFDVGFEVFELDVIYQ